MASEYLKRKYQDVKPEEKRELTAAERRKNWWHYHWFYLLIALLAAAVLWGVLRERGARVESDCSVALVTRYAATPGEIASLQAALERALPDVNGDGEVHVAVNAIQIDYTSTELDEAAIQVMTTNVDKLNADFYTRQSGVFLLDDPENFQRSHGALSYLDGSAPEEGAVDWENMALPLSVWPGGTGIAWDNCLPETLWLARRVVLEEADEVAFAAGAQALWDALTGES